MSLQTTSMRAPEQTDRPDLSLLAIVESDQDIDPERWHDLLHMQGSLLPELVVLDRRERACGLPEGVRTLHRPGPYPGPALEDAIALCRGRALGFIGSVGRRSVEHLPASLRVLDHQPEVEAVLTDCVLFDPRSRELNRIDLHELPSSPPPGWLEGALFRTESLGRLSDLAFFPVLLQHYRDMHSRGAIRHLPLAGYRMAEIAFKAALPDYRAQAQWLDIWCDSDESVAPEISIIVVSQGPARDLYGCLRSLCRQSIAAPSIQVVLVAEGASGSLEGIVPDRYPVRVDLVRRRVHGLAKALNKALTQCVAPTTALCAPRASIDSGWAQQHLMAHRQRPLNRIAVSGPVLEPPKGTPLSPLLDHQAMESLGQTFRGLSLSNMSFPTRAIQALGGWAPANSAGAMVLDLGLRMIRHGIQIVARPAAIVRRLQGLSLGEMESLERAQGRAQVEACGSNPDAVDALGLADLELQELRRRSKRCDAGLPGWEESVRRHLEARSTKTVGSPIPPKLSSLVEELAQAWRLRGQIDGLRAHTVSGFGDFLRSAPLRLPDDLKPAWVLLPEAEGDETWIVTLQTLLRSRDRRPIVLWAHPDGGYGQGELANITAALRHRAALGLGRTAAEVFVLQPHPPRGRMIRFLHGSWGWVRTEGSAQRDLAKLADAAQIPHRPIPGELIAANPLPWPISAAVSLRFLAWPRWDRAAELDHLLSRYGGLLLGRDDSCLCLRLDPDLDPPLDNALAALEASFDRCLDSSAHLEMLVLDEILDSTAWGRLGAAMDGTLWLESSHEPARSSRLESSKAPQLSSPMALQRLLERAKRLSVEDSQARLLFLDLSTPG